MTKDLHPRGVVRDLGLLGQARRLHQDRVLAHTNLPTLFHQGGGRMRFEHRAFPGKSGEWQPLGVTVAMVTI